MFKLITFDGNEKVETIFETFDEVLSGALHAFDLNHELIEIRKDDECILLHCEIYEKIGKVYY